MLFGPLSLSLAPYVKSSKTLTRWLKPVANWYADACGYRKYGFKYDDLLMEERDDVQRALTRLTVREKYDRAYRLKRASQASVLHAPLPKDQWTPASEDIPYLKPHVLNVVKEDSERRYWDTLDVKRN
ncbi:Cytochrome b-c1 complex subunit 7 [Termitomyces sp. T112]|nr:hypothetical protein C0989_007789 [Termitomyces sp. Mn162]KAG5732812.1 Cytochrome b-c1 complex subunit 7 [Termitomyces sp. T112]KAH0584248.1 hypothetical protein H2248_009800 [Termitomyces sp. 'cryptogamus']KNZ71548.1 Cytochrome b-c1 complex subunit 7 [Termitomyces sp. J132]